MTSRVENITPEGARRRRQMGVVFLFVSLGAAAWLVAFDAPRLWRLALVIPFWLSANGFLQARERTCIALGAAGKRERAGGGVSPLSDAECEIVKRRVLAIVAFDFAIALAATAIVYWIPA